MFFFIHQFWKKTVLDLPILPGNYLLSGIETYHSFFTRLLGYWLCYSHVAFFLFFLYNLSCFFALLLFFLSHTHYILWILKVVCVCMCMCMNVYVCVFLHLCSCPLRYNQMSTLNVFLCCFCTILFCFDSSSLTGRGTPWFD